MIKIKNKTKGFTLIELILYIGLSSLILFIITLSVLFFTSVKHKTQTVTEVQDETFRLADVVSTRIRASRTVVSPTLGNSSSRLQLEMLDAAKNPTIIELEGTKVYIKEGTSAKIYLNNDLIKVNSINFSNKKSSSTPDIINFEISTSFNKTNDINEFNYDYQLSSTASTFYYEE